jgi:flagellar protein FliO/FliZ
MFEALFGSELPVPVRFIIAFVFVLALIGGAAYLVRRFGAGALSSAGARGRQPRLAVVDSAPIDGRRRLVIVRRDNVEHLVMIGGPSDVVVETNIVRAAPAATGREPAPMRPEPMVRPGPASEGNMWPLQPEPLGRPQRPPQPMEEPAWNNAPVAEPMMRVPNGERLASRAPEMSRPVPEAPVRVAPEPPVRAAPEPAVRAAPDVPPVRAPEYAPAAVRPSAEPRRAPMVAAPPPPAPPPPAPPASAAPPVVTASDEQNLAEMAHRLEAALRRPNAAPPSVEPVMARPAPEPVARPVMAEPAPAPMIRHAPPPETPRPAPEPRYLPAEPNFEELRPADHRLAEPKPAAHKPPEPKPQGTKSVYDSLEQEMASLLGRPSGKS